MSISTKNRSKRSTNISGGLQKEIQALIAYACYDSPSLIRRGGSIGESAIEDKMTSIFNGEGKNGADPNLLDHLRQSVFARLEQIQGAIHAVGTGSRRRANFIHWRSDSFDSSFLHRHKKLFIYVGEVLIDKEILSQKSLLSVGGKILGRTLHRNAKRVLCNCKKMMAIWPMKLLMIRTISSLWLRRWPRQCKRSSTQDVLNAIHHRITRVASVRRVSAHCVVASESSKMFGGAMRASKHKESRINNWFAMATTILMRRTIDSTI